MHYLIQFLLLWILTVAATRKSEYTGPHYNDISLKLLLNYYYCKRFSAYHIFLKSDTQNKAENMSFHLSIRRLFQDKSVVKEWKVISKTDISDKKLLRNLLYNPYARFDLNMDQKLHKAFKSLYMFQDGSGIQIIREHQMIKQKDEKNKISNITDCQSPILCDSSLCRQALNSGGVHNISILISNFILSAFESLSFLSTAALYYTKESFESLACNVEFFNESESRLLWSDHLSEQLIIDCHGLDDEIAHVAFLKYIITQANLPNDNGLGFVKPAIHSTIFALVEADYIGLTISMQNAITRTVSKEAHLTSYNKRSLCILFSLIFSFVVPGRKQAGLKLLQNITAEGKYFIGHISKCTYNRIYDGLFNKEEFLNMSTLSSTCNDRWTRLQKQRIN